LTVPTVDVGDQRMTGRIRGRSARSVSIRPHVCEGVQTLERALAEIARTIPADSVESREPNRVLLDITVDRIHCVLMSVDTEAPIPELTLSPRELEIARMVARGLPNKTIAAVLDISPWTVHTHVRRMFAKLQVTSRAALVGRMLSI
jgi:DNA-binding CsgD family transcriptional regulator